VTLKEPILALEPFERIIRDPDHNDHEFAASIGVTRDMIRGWRKNNGIRFYTADRICTRLGLHPSYIWGEDYWNAPYSNKRVIQIDNPQEEQ
jgi:DNA-binding Xre family transcriptional regulator